MESDEKSQDKAKKVLFPERIHTSLVRALTINSNSSEPSELFEVTSKPSTCIKCHSSKILEIIYGFYESPKPLGEEYALGGCVIEIDSPKWECGNCNAQFVDVSGSEPEMAEIKAMPSTP